MPVGSALGDAEAPFQDNHTSAGTTSFQADIAGVYVVALQVDDGALESEVSFAIIDVLDAEQTPVANAGVDRMIAVGAEASLDASQSYDPMGGTLTYLWTLADTPDNSDLLPVDLVGSTERVASFTPDVTGSYTATLVVDNGVTTSIPDAVQITATGPDEGPVAVVVPSYAGEDCNAIPVDCTGAYDPEGDTLTYFWDVQARPDGSMADGSAFADRAAASTTLWADAAGDYVVTCSVFDGNTWSDPAEMTIELTERAINGPPDVYAGSDAEIAMGEADCANVGAGSWDCESCPAIEAELGGDGYAIDPDGDPLIIEWVVDDGDATMLSGASMPGSALLGEITPDRSGFCTDDTFEFVVTVTDCPGEQVDDLLRLTGRCCGVNGGG